MGRAGSSISNRRQLAAAVGIAGLAAAILALGALTAIRITWLADSTARQRPLPQTDTAIVLGAMAWGTEPSPALAERLDPAAQLYQAGLVRHIILTGGVDTGGVISEAEASARYLERRWGIPRNAVALDEASTSTATNLLNAKRLMQQHGWRTATIVTHGYHLHRAMLLAGDIGLSGPGVGVESKVLILPPLVAREVVALGVYWAWEHWVWRGVAPLTVGAADATLAVLALLALIWLSAVLARRSAVR